MVSSAAEGEAEAPELPILRREPGQLVAHRYRLEQQLAEGGMGVVFRARDERNGAEVALKQLRVMPGLAHDTLAAIGVQFEREYHTLIQLSHPCIISVYDYGVDEGGAYYTMELLRGQDLRQRGKLPWRQACTVLRDVASALAILQSRRLLHRDVTARNVFCTESGRSKLIDFGAMMTMGVAKHLVGTPAFVPLEALQQQALDGRADLYSLGALAYFVLTGTYAYSARSFSELKERFGTPPPTLRQREPEIPEALDALVMSLLQLDRAARPNSAAEVMERLSGIAGLPLEERAEVSRAYLSTPMLVGREASLERVGLDLLAARKGLGTSVLFEGSPGSGRSRLLDACVLQAKLRGAVVLRSDASDAARGAYGIARALGLQLLDALPIEARRAARAERAALAHVLPELFSRHTLQTSRSLRPSAAPERHRLQTELRDFFLDVARDKHLVIAVDDLDRGDEPSVAMLGAMAHGARRRCLNLLCTVATNAQATAALALVKQESTALSIAPLSPAETEQLLRSVFGEVPHVAALAERIHALAAGSPNATMMLAEHLVTQRIARYEAGSWALPEQLRADHLPSSTGAALLARIAELPPDARELAETLALTDPETIAPELYTRLSEHTDAGRTYRALEALTASGVLSLVGDRYRFTQFDAGVAIAQGLEPERTRALHARLARALAGTATAQRIAQHMLLGGQERAAIDHMLAKFAGATGAGAPSTRLTQLALDAAERLGLPLRTRLELRTLLLQGAAQTGQYPLFMAHADVLAARLEQDSGLRDYAQLPAEMEHGARLQEALRRTRERSDATPPSERGFSAQELPACLFRVYGAFSSMSAIAQELEMIERLPRLDPLLGQAPMIEWLHTLIEIQLAHRAGRNTTALKLAETLVERLANVQTGAVALARQLRTSVLYMCGLFAATSGRSETLDQMRELQQMPGQRGNAWRMRMIYELMTGNMEAAADCQRRAELVNLQDGGQLQFPGTTLRSELIAYVSAEDLIGVKRATERIAELAEIYPGWRPTFAAARCHYRRLQGDPAGALAALEPFLELRAGRHMDWWLVTYSHVRVLVDLDRAAEAARLGAQAIETWRSEGLSTVDYGLGQVTADALLRAGLLDDAQRTIDAYIAVHEREKTRGLRLGLAYETRARVAIALRDEQAAQHYARLCAEQYKGGRHVALLNRYARLLREADAGGIAVVTGLRIAGDTHTATSRSQLVDTLETRFQSCVDPSSRADAGLCVLLEASGAESGFLYGSRDGQLEKLAPVSSEPPSGLREWLDSYVTRELEREASTTIESGASDAADATRFRDGSGREYEPVLLSGPHKGSQVVAGIAAIRCDASRRRSASRAMIAALTEIMLKAGTLEPME